MPSVTKLAIIGSKKYNGKLSARSKGTGTSEIPVTLSEMAFGGVNISDYNFDEFEIYLDFKKNSNKPSHVFKAMSGIIDSFYSLDKDLIESFSVNIEPDLILEDIQTGSLRSILRTALISIDDEALKNLNWKKAIGSYLVKTKYLILNYLKDTEEIKDIKQVQELENLIQVAAENNGVDKIPIYTPISPKKLLNNISKINKASSNLSSEEKVRYISQYGKVDINKDFNITTGDIEELLTRDVVEKETDMTLMVKKPDYLGISKWDMYLEDHIVQVKVLDMEWLENFQSRKLNVRPGDSIEARVKITRKYGYNNNIISENYSIIKVYKIIKQEPPYEFPKLDFNNKEE
jgi:hypothetical protein